MSAPGRRIFLSPPFVGDAEREAVARAFDTGYVAPCGPMVDEFESRLAALAGRRHAVALSSGTAALDLAMAELGVDTGWTVVAPTLTFVATVGPAHRRGAKLVFADCDATGNVDVGLLGEAVEAAVRARGAARTLVIGVDLYGRCCDYAAIESLCARHGVRFVCDSAESVGARAADGRPSGAAGAMAAYSFNGNKIVTTSGGGALLTDDDGVAARARKRSQQSREACAWYEHREVGYNYRLSNLLASVGLAQLDRLGEIVATRARIGRRYRDELARWNFLPPDAGGNNWLAVAFAPTRRLRDEALDRLAAANVEARPVWKPMHLQPVFAGCETRGGGVAESLFERGLCLPTGTGLSEDDQARVIAAVKGGGA